MRLIDAEALAQHFMNKQPDYYHTSYIVGEITAAPTVDRVERVNPVKPEFRRGVPSCGKCGNVLANHYRNCPWCGYEVN